MNPEELRALLREELTVRPSEEQVTQAMRSRSVEEVASKSARINDLERELEGARQSLVSSEDLVRQLDEQHSEIQG